MNSIRLVEEYPLPFDPEEIIEMQEEIIEYSWGPDNEDDIIEMRR